MRASDERPGRGEPTDAELLAMTDDEFVESTAYIASLLAEGPAEIEPEAPSGDLWAAIAAGVSSPSLRASETSIVRETETTTVVDPFAQSNELTPAVSRARSRWGGRTAVLTLVAAAVLLVLVPIGLSLSSDGDDPVVLASAQLEVLTADAASGSAELVAADDKLLELELDATAPDGEYLELWLLAVDDEGLTADPISLGRVNGSGQYAIPAGVDTSVFDVVDVSIEADDGDASHSGKSVLRGALTT